MEKNDIINLENIPESPKKESSYKNFPFPEIIYKPKNKIILLPRIKNLKNINIELNKNNINNKQNENNNNSNSIKDKCLSENKRLKLEDSKKSVHNVIINPKQFPKLYSLPNKEKIKIHNLKSIINKDNNLNINISEFSNCKSNCLYLNKNLPKITITSDKLYNRFKDGMSKLKQKPLEIITKKNNNSAHTIDNKKDDIFKTTEIFQNIKLGSKYDPEDVNSYQEDEKIEFNEKIKNLIYNLNNKKNRSRNIHMKNCYEILDDIKKKKTYDCERLIEKTSDEAQKYRKQIHLIYNNLKKTFEQNEEWNNFDYFYN